MSKPLSTASDPAADVERLDPEAFAAAFMAHSRALWCIAAAVLVDRDQVEDVLQEGATIALEKLDQFQPGTNFLAWMGRIVRYVALNHGRGRRRRRAATPSVDPATIEQVASARPARVGPSATARGDLPDDQDAFDDHVVAALHDLGETARSCLLLRTLIELSYREIALALDIPEGTAMSHVHRARRAMRDHLNRSEDSGKEHRTGARSAP